jgi:drug/metabolite transporter (DMT)-like permease
MAHRSSLDLRAMGLMLALCMLWGFQQVAVKATAGEIAPIMVIGLRSALSALLVAGLMGLRGERLDLADGSWRAGMAVGSLFALEFLLVAQALRWTTAGHVAVFLYTAPIFASLGLHRKLPAERLRPLQWAGIVLAFAGVGLAFLGRSSASSAAANDHQLLGDLLALLGGASWGATTVVVRTTRLSNAPATKTLLYQLVGAALLLLIAAALSGQTRFEPTPLVLANLAFQTVLVSFASFLVWFWLLRHYLASELGVFSFLTPLFGVGFGVWLLHEPLEPSFVLGALLVLTGIVLVSGHVWVRQRWQALRAGPAS